MAEFEIIEPYNSEDSDWDDEGLTPRSLSKLKVKKRKHKKAWIQQETKRREANRKSNSQVWKNYLDKHEPIIFFPKAAKLVADIAKSKNRLLLYPDGSEYRGPVRGIKPEGDGVMQFPEGGGSYVGEFSDGVPHGQGRRVYANGESYVGRWKNGRRHGFGTITDKSDSQVLYEGLWRDGHKSHQANYAAGLPARDRQEIHRARVKFNNLGSIASATDAMVEQMLTSPALPEPTSVHKYVAQKRIKKTKTKIPFNRDNDDNDGGAAKVSAFYVKKEKLKNIKEAWHAYPHARLTAPLHRVAVAKVSVKIEQKYTNMLRKRGETDAAMTLSKKARKQIYVRERKALMNDYERGLGLLRAKFKKQRALTLKMGIMRGGIAIERSVREVKKLKDEYIQKNKKMMERRQRAIKAMKDEYLEDVQHLRYKTSSEHIQMKSMYLETAWSRHRLEVEQEQKDEERAFAEDRRKEREKKQAARIREALSSQKSGKQKRRVNADNDLEDNDGQKARRLYQLSSLSKAIRPSFLQELKLAWTQWQNVTTFKRITSGLRLDLVKVSGITTAGKRVKGKKGVRTTVQVEL